MSAVTIFRFDPQTMAEPVYRTYAVPFDEGLTVMDALLHIYRNIDATLAFRSSCQCGLCLACLIRIDGTPRCPCKTFMKDKMLLEPLSSKKLVRDLVVQRDRIETKE